MLIFWSTNQKLKIATYVCPLLQAVIEQLKEVPTAGGIRAPSAELKAPLIS